MIARFTLALFVSIQASTAVQPNLDHLRQEGYSALYALDYRAAGRAFDRLIELAPDRPEGYLYRATNTWFRSLFEQRLLSTSLYSKDDFYAQKERDVDPAVDKAFRADLQSALTFGEARLRQNPADVEALYYLGAVHGTLAGYEASMARAFFSALEHGSKSVELHEKVLKLDPNYADAYLTVGLYHYTVGSLPLAVKLLLALGGVRGSRTVGIAELERVAREGRRNADDAKVVLISLYTRERQFESALRLLDEMRQKYPSNFVVGIEQALTLAQMGRNAEAARAFEVLRKDARAMRDAADYIEFSCGETLARAGRYAEALTHYNAVVEWPRADPDRVTLAHLGAGQCLDLLKRRQEAMQRYRYVMRRPNILDSRRRAETLLKAPYVPPAN